MPPRYHRQPAQTAEDRPATARPQPISFVFFSFFRPTPRIAVRFSRKKEKEQKIRYRTICHARYHRQPAQTGEDRPATARPQSISFVFFSFFRPTETTRANAPKTRRASATIQWEE